MSSEIIIALLSLVGTLVGAYYSNDISNHTKYFRVSSCDFSGSPAIYVE